MPYGPSKPLPGMPSTEVCRFAGVEFGLLKEASTQYGQAGIESLFAM